MDKDLVWKRFHELKNEGYAITPYLECEIERWMAYSFDERESETAFYVPSIG